MKKMKLAAVSVVGALLLAVFGVAPASANPDSSPEKVVNVAIIGDSYTAGNGVGNYSNRNKDGSYYSLDNWGNKYVEWLNAQDVNAQLVAPLAYSGSVTDDLLCPQDQGRRQKYDYGNGECVPTNAKSGKNPGGQIARIPDDTDLVLLTIGGNDVHFADIVKQCFTIGIRDAATCEKQVDKAKKNLDSPTNYSDKEDSADNLEVSVTQKTQTVLEHLDKKLKPSAEVVLVGYPLLSTDRPYGLVDDELFREETVDANAHGYPASGRVRELGVKATEAQQNIVDKWNEQSGEHVKVHYVASIADAFAGHEPDPSAHSRNGDKAKKMGTHSGRWINEFLETKTRMDANGAVHSETSLDLNNWYHPGVTGHEKIADEIVKTVGIPASAHTVSESSVSTQPVDVVLIVDSNGSMGQVHSLLQSAIQEIIRRILAQTVSARFAVTSYHYAEGSGEYAGRVDTAFTEDVSEIEKSFDAMGEANRSEDSTQSTVYSGVDSALKLDWRPEARKIAIVIGDSPARNPEEGTGYTAQAMTRLSAQAGGVEIYAIDTQKAAKSSGAGLTDESMNNLAQATGGETYEAASLQDIPGLIDEVVADSLAQPSAWLQGPIGGYTGQALDFDARGSYSVNGQIVKYEWDFDGDGTYEQTTKDGYLSRSFDAPIDTVARVRVTDEAGYSAIATAPVLVTVEPAPQPAADPLPVEDKPDVHEVTDEKAVELYPELEPVAKDASLPETASSSTPSATPSKSGTVTLPVTGVSIGLPVAIAVLTIIIGIIVVVVIRKRSQK